MSDAPTDNSVARIRIVIGAAGVLLGLFGVFRLLTEVPTADLELLAVWLVAAVLLHDGVLAPFLVGVGWLIGRFVPPRARSVVQPALIVAGLVTVIALPLIHREDTQPISKGILRQDYGGNLAVALGIVAAVALVGYVVRLVRDRQQTRPRRQRARAANERPESVHDSSLE